MIKLPEPFLVRQEDACGDEVGPPIPYYTEAQLKQAVRDALEEAATICDDEPEERTGDYGAYESSPYACGNAIRALIKEIDA